MSLKCHKIKSGKDTNELRIMAYELRIDLFPIRPREELSA